MPALGALDSKRVPLERRAAQPFGKSMALACGAWLLVLAALPTLAKEDQAQEDPAPAVPDAAESAYLTHDYIFVDSPAIEAYLGQVAQRLLDAKSIKMAAPRVLLHSSDSFDVFTDSKQNLVVSTGALRQLDNEDELAAVLGHELGHLILKHPGNKDVLRLFPLTMETVDSVKTTSNQLRGVAPPRYTGELSKLDGQSLAGSQSVNLLWNDILSPSWNRKQESAADVEGFELMRTAGYDPSAFGGLFKKLHAAEAQRSERLEALRKVMLARAKLPANPEPARPAAAQNTSTDLKTTAMNTAEDLKRSAQQTAIDESVKGLANLNRDYDSPDDRQMALAEYARQHRLMKRVPHPDSQFESVLRHGESGHLLILDLDGIQTLDALNARNSKVANEMVKPLLPMGTNAKPAAPHLNLAIGSWYHAHGRRDLGERYANDWLGARRPPAQAYVWVAYYQAERREFPKAIDTLERGRVRTNSGAPFLPHLVSLARAAGDKSQAEKYTFECAQEDKKNLGNVVTAFVQNQKATTGLYADCVQRLGYDPGNSSQGENKFVQALKTPINGTKSLTQKLRDKLRRN